MLVNLNGEGIGTSFHLDGEGFLLISVVAYAFASSLLKIYSKEEDPVTLSGWQFMAGGLVMIVGGYLLGGRISKVTLPGMAVLIYLACCVSSVAFSLWGILLKYHPVSKIAIFGFTNPVFGVLLSTLILREESQNKGLAACSSPGLSLRRYFLVNKPPKKGKVSEKNR